MVDLILFADSSYGPRQESKNYKMKKFLPIAGLKLTISRLLNRRSNQLGYMVVLTIDI